MKIKRKFKYIKGAVPSIMDIFNEIAAWENEYQKLLNPNEYTPPEAPDKGIEPNADFDNMGFD